MGQTISISKQDVERMEIRMQNPTLLVKQITNEGIKQIIQEVLKLDMQLLQISNKINKKENFTISLDGSYRGERQNKFIQNGYGEWISDNQEKYSLGVWKNNKLEGRGCSLFLTDQLNHQYYYYFGEYKKGKPHGKGSIKFSDGMFYEGDWFDGEMTGKGVICVPQKLQYNGQVKEGQMQGQGKLQLMGNPQDESRNQFSNGSVLQEGEIVMEGYFYKDQFCNGIVRRKDGTYVGQMKEGKMDGNGKFIWNDGNFYDGEFKNNKRHGIGNSKDRNGNLKVAKWVDDNQIQILSYCDQQQ